jgi:hypothetical protein
VVCLCYPKQTHMTVLGREGRLSKIAGTLRLRSGSHGLDEDPSDLAPLFPPAGVFNVNCTALFTSVPTRFFETHCDCDGPC